MVGVDLDRRRNEDQIGAKGMQLVAEARSQLVAETAIGKAEKDELGVFTEGIQGSARFLLAHGRGARLRSVRGHDDAYGSAFVQVVRDQTSATDHLVVRMGSEDEQPFAAEQRRFVRNRLRLDQHAGIV